MRTIITFTAVAMILATSPALAQHATHGGSAKGVPVPHWTAYPMVVSAGGFSRSGAKYQAFNLHAMDSSSYASFYGQGADALAGATQTITIEDNGQVAVKSGEQGGYYLVRVSGHGPDGEEATATTLKYFSNPGPAPRDLLKAKRPGFEITPTILPREHAHYRENETWAFTLRMDGKPMAGLAVVLETSNGTKAEFITQDDGIVEVTFPGDFKDIPKEQWRHGRPPASKFVVAVRNGGLLATYNDQYNLDAYGDKNLWAGIGFAMLGMIAAVPIVRRRKKT
ncbi:MAG: hypothetical protein JKY27_01045 [Magnetovibrio sp.]|nr:hypothetical protein [Magnetovibrio sp.]